MSEKIDRWNIGRMIRDNIRMYHFFKERGRLELALYNLRQALFLRTMTLKESEKQHERRV